jgi:hypothetical protein
MDVARSFEGEQKGHQARRRHILVQDRLDHAIADAIDIGVTEEMRQRDHHQADRSHTDDVLGVGVAR